MLVQQELMELTGSSMLDGKRFPWTDLDASEVHVLVDDLVHSGHTAERYEDATNKPVYPLFTKQHKAPWTVRGALCVPPEEWVCFPWERGTLNDSGTDSQHDIFTRLLQFIGEDAKREGLLETPDRASKAWAHWCSGYGKDPASVLKVFEDGAGDYDQVVLVRDIPVYSHCEHHLAPIFGVAHVGYIPNGKIVGLSKLNRLVDLFARRLQVQERLTTQIADALDTHLSPVGVGVVLECRHMCMESRGVCQQGHATITSALRGVFLEQQSARAEFMQLVR
jgi:GTP cyclohydrolase I